MDNHRLKNIIKEIQQNEGVGLAEIAARTGLDRSYLSSFIHAKDKKGVTEKMFGKLAKGYPPYFAVTQQKPTENPLKEVRLPTGNAIRTLADYISMIENYNKTLSAAVEAGLINLKQGQQQIKDQIVSSSKALAVLIDNKHSAPGLVPQGGKKQRKVKEDGTSKAH